MTQQTANAGRVVYPASTDENLANIQANFTELYATTASLSGTTAAGAIGSIDTATTPASGTCAVQFTLNDADGDPLTAIQAGLGYLSDSDGALVAAGTSVETLTNGSISTLVIGQVFMWVSKADGTLGVTLTAAAASYYITLVAPNGTILVSDEIVVNS